MLQQGLGNNQAAAAERCSSRTHCRGLVAFAATPATGWRLGIDIEYAEPRRDWPGIITKYAPELASGMTPRRGAALWSFGEAWFKAVGSAPGPAPLARLAAELPEADGPVALSLEQDGTFLHAWGRPVAAAPAFWLFAVAAGPQAAPPAFDLLSGGLDTDSG